jgi:hypothetical protein
MTRTTFAGSLSAILITVLTPAAHAGSENVELHMIHSMKESLARGSVSFGVFTQNGPKESTLQKAPRRVEFVTFDAKTSTYYGQKTSAIGTIGASGKLEEIEPPPSVDLSHAGGLAFDDARRRVLIASQSGAGTVIYEYGVDTNAWSELGNLGRERLHGLAYDASEGLIFALEQQGTDNACTKLLAFTRSGVQVQSTSLSEALPLYTRLYTTIQLAFENDAVYVLASHYAHPRAANALYRIEPRTGRVTREPYNESLDLSTKTWPGWKTGPAPSLSPSAAGARGGGHYSNYTTPNAIMRNQPTELHVVVVSTGGMDAGRWRKKGKNADFDLDASTLQNPVVEVAIGRTDKPVTLALVSSTSILWSIEPARGAQIDRVITFSAFSEKTKVVGVDPSIVENGGDRIEAVPAWELDQGQTAVEFDDMIADLRRKISLRENSYQAMSQGERFEIPLPTSKVAGAR